VGGESLGGNAVSDDQPHEGEHYEPMDEEGHTGQEAQVPVPAGPAATAATQLKRGRRGTEFTNVNEALAYATACYRSGMLPEHIKSPQQAFVIMDNGAELGLRPWAAWKLIYITKQGRIATMSKGALAVVQASPNFEDYDERIELEGTDEMRAVAIAKRKGRKATVKTFSLEDAKAADLLTRKKNRRGEEYDGPWQSFVKDMLLARARDRALSVAFAAELAGIELETMAEDADRLDAGKASSPAQPVGAPKELPADTEEPKALPPAKADPLLMHTLKAARGEAPVAATPPAPAPAPAPEPSREEIETGVDEALGPPEAPLPPPPKKTQKKRVKPGDIIHGTRRVLEVDDEGRPLVVEKLSKEELEALHPAMKADAPARQAADGTKTCPRDYCGAPLNLLGDCDACGWPSSNWGQER
jgi:hypothetical protein